MAFCSHCGAPLEEGQNFCAACGQCANAQSAAPDTTPSAAPVADTPYQPDDIAQAKPTTWLAYFGILFLVPLLACKDSPYARFHVNQGLALFILDLAWSAVCNTVIAWLDIGVLSVAADLVSLGLLALAIVGIVQVCQGQAKPLPLIGKWRLLK